MRRKYFTNTRVAGVQYGEALFCREVLKPGKELKMKREVGNLYDHNAIALYCGDYRIGYIPSADNKQLVTFLDQGWSDIFEVYIDRYDEDVHPERQIGITIFAKEKE